MDTLNFALKLMGKDKTTEERNGSVNPSTASIIHMIAVTPSSGGKVVLKDEIESSAEWSAGDYIEIEEDGTFEEYESIDDPLEDIDDSVVDLTDGDGADIEGTDEQSVSFSVDDYHAAAVNAYAMETVAEEPEATEDTLANESASITDAIDDGDAKELPNDGETSEEDGLADVNASVGEVADDEYTLKDDNSDDESDDYVEGAEVSDGYTIAECIGSINAGDRVAVMVQDGKVVVLGVIGSGDEQRANTENAQQTADEANEAADEANIAAEIAQAAAENAQEQAAEAQGQAIIAKTAAENAQAQANTAETAANNAQTLAQNASAQSQAAQEQANTAQEQASAAQAVVDTVRNDIEQTNKELEAYAKSLETISNTMEADFAKKTDLSETEAELRTQISQNANEIESVATRVTEVNANVNEAVGEAKQQADAAVATAQAAQGKAEEAKASAENAQAQANTAQAAAESAQNEANTAQQAAVEAQRIANQADADLETAKQNLAEITSRVDATEDEIAEAEAAVAQAQAAAEAAKTDAQIAQNTAETAKSNATTAQQSADNAKSAADAAQSAADKAQAAADKAQADVNSLGVRVTTAETKIQQNSELIALMATKTEVAQTLAGYYTKEQADAAIKVQADKITSSVSNTYATKYEVENIEIGARNLFSGYGEEEIQLNDYQGVGSFTQFFNLTFDPSEFVGEEFTISLYAKSPNGSTALYVYNQNVAPRYFYLERTELDKTLGDEWEYYTCTFVNTDRGEGYEPSNKIEIYAPNQMGVLVKKIKVEKGNKATDWTPAPEDIASSDLVENTRSNIADALDEVISDVETVNDTVNANKDSLDAALQIIEANKSQISTLIQEASGFTMNFSTLTETIAEVEGRLETETSERVKYIRFIDGEIWLGKEAEPNENDFKVSISNERMSFWQNGNEVAYLSNNKLFITDAQVTGTFNIGAPSGHFEWKTRNGGLNLGVRWVSE